MKRGGIAASLLILFSVLSVIITRPILAHASIPPLTWRPPITSCPPASCSVQTLTNTGSHQSIFLDSTRDWVLTFPAVPIVGGIDVVGGHNVLIGGTVNPATNAVTMTGGEIDLTVPCASDRSECHGIQLETDSTNPPNGGEAYIEGIYIKGNVAGTNDPTGDGIELVQTYPGGWARVTIQAVRVNGLQGCNIAPYADAHADVFQPYAPAGAAIRVDHLTGETSYQGMQIAPDDGINPPEARRASSLDFRNVQIKAVPNTLTGCAGNNNVYAWWIAGDGNGCGIPPTNLSNTLAVEPYGLNFNAVWPDTNAGTPCDGVYYSGVPHNVSWPALTPLTGRIYGGTGSEPFGFCAVPPPIEYEDCVPNGSVGIGYVSPGYQ